MLRYVRELDFAENPNYEHLKYLLKSAFTNGKFVYDFKFDWIDSMVIETYPNIFIIDSTPRNKYYE